MAQSVEVPFSPGNRVPPRLSGPGHKIRTSRPVFVVLALAVLSAGALVLFLFNPSDGGFYPFCAFYRSTGLLCPGCGSLRATHLLLHGHIVGALHFNVLFVLSLPFLGWFVLRCIVARLRNQSLPNLNFSRGWYWSAFALLLLFGIARNLPFAHGLWLAP